MRLGIKAKQIAAVTAIVGLAVAMLSAVHVARLARVVLHESQARGELLANTIFHRAREVVVAGGSQDLFGALRNDPGLRAILESSIYGESVTEASILDTQGTVRASSDRALEGKRLPTTRADLATLVNGSALDQLRTIYSQGGRTLEVQQKMVLGDEPFGSIHIGVSTVLMRQELSASLRPAINIAIASLLIAVIVAALLAQLFLRPINVIRSGLTRLGKGEFGVTLDLDRNDEFGDLGTFFNTVSQQLSADRTLAAEQRDPRQLARKLVALSRLTAGLAHEVKNPLNAMMIHLELLRTKIKRSAARPEPVAAGGIGLAEAPRVPGAEAEALQHVEIIENEIRRLDEVVQGFLRFTRPEDLKLQPVLLKDVFDEILPLIEPEAQKNNVRVEVTAPADIPRVNADTALLRQAFLNLAINACQAMPDGGTLRMSCASASGNRVEVRFEDTGVGIPAEHLSKIFDLYFTTKDHGTGIGLSMVYRIIQLHDGEIEVESTKGRGTTFRVLLPRASET